MVTPIATECVRCKAVGQVSLFCQNCGQYLPDETGTVERVTFTRRFFGTYLLESLLFILTLIIGWFIWLAFTASDSQSPAKKLVDVYVIDVDVHQAVSPGRIWVREVLVKILLLSLAGAITGGLIGLIDGLWVLIDKDRQALHDKVATTVVVYAPNGLPSKMMRGLGS